MAKHGNYSQAGLVSTVFFNTMTRLDLGHLNPLLEDPTLTCLGWESYPGSPASQACTLAKSYSNSLNYCYSKFLHMYSRKEPL